MKMKIQQTKTIGCSKNNSKREVTYNDTVLPQEIR